MIRVLNRLCPDEATKKALGDRDRRIQMLAAELKSHGIAMPAAAKAGAKRKGKAEGKGKRAQSPSAKEVECYNCGEKGHYKRDCTKPPKSPGNTPPVRSGASSPRSGASSAGDGKTCHFHRPWLDPPKTCNKGSSCTYVHANEKPGKGGVARLMMAAVVAASILTQTASHKIHKNLSVSFGGSRDWRIPAEGLGQSYQYLKRTWKQKWSVDELPEIRQKDIPYLEEMCNATMYAFHKGQRLQNSLQIVSSHVTREPSLPDLLQEPTGKASSAKVVDSGASQGMKKIHDQLDVFKGNPITLDTATGRIVHNRYCIEDLGPLGLQTSLALPSTVDALSTGQVNRSGWGFIWPTGEKGELGTPVFYRGGTLTLTGPVELITLNVEDDTPMFDPEVCVVVPRLEEFEMILDDHRVKSLAGKASVDSVIAVQEPPCSEPAAVQEPPCSGPAAVQEPPCSVPVLVKPDKIVTSCTQFGDSLVPVSHYATHLDSYSSICEQCKTAKQRRNYARARGPSRTDDVKTYGHVRCDWYDTGPKFKTFGNCRYSLHIKD